MPSGGVHFRVWAPECAKVEVIVDGAGFELEREDSGYHSGLVDSAGANTLYRYRLDGGGPYPDPASRFQPRGPHADSQVIDPSTYSWNDSAWRGLALQGQIIYEMHIGTFTAEGTWNAALRYLPDLADIGITVVEVMPVNEFPGEFGWGYDGVQPYAPTRLYGTPDDFRAFVDRAHALGMAVILDVVYNHLGPDGNYFGAFSKYYFTARHETDWGAAINYYDEHCGPVREFFIANAGYWISEYHLDGLRLDATQNVYDESKDHILAAITREVRRAAGGCETIVVGENEPQDVKLIRPPEEGGYGLDALWNDDFHHSAMVRMTGQGEAYYTDYYGTPQEFISAAKYGYLYQGQWYGWQKQRRGTPTIGLPPPAFINFLQNHDQVANSARGARVITLTSPGVHRAMSALTLLMPGTPMLFQGEEFGATTPFLFFADHKPDLAKLVQEGRRKYLTQFRSLAEPVMWPVFAAPHARDTFERSKLSETERQGNVEQIALHRDLIRLRRENAAFQVKACGTVDGAVLSGSAFVLRYFAGGDGDRLLVVNLGSHVDLARAAEPLLAPPEGKEWDVIWSSEDPQYGGTGTPPLDTVENWRIPGQAAVVLAPVERKRTAFTVSSFSLLP